MSQIQIAIEGTDAVAATEALLALPELKGSYKTVGDSSKEGTLATVATIVGIVGGGMAIGEQLRKWYGEYKDVSAPGPRIEKVLIVTPNQRILMEGATPEEIAQVISASQTPST